MSWISAAGTGLAAAGTVTSVHQLLKDRVKKAPRIDLLGEKVIKKLYKKAHLSTPSHKNAYRGSIASAIVGNTLLYSLVAIGGKKYALAKGAIVGLTIGLKSAFLPERLGLGSKYSNRNKPMTAMTVGLYFLGGMAAAGAIVLFEKLSKRRANKKTAATDATTGNVDSAVPADHLNVVATA